MTLEYLMGQLAGGVADASIFGQIPFFSGIAHDKAVELGEKLGRYFENYESHIQKKAQEIMSHKSEGNLDFVACAAKECFGMVDAENILTETHYDARALSREKADAYLKKQKYLDENEKQLLETYLAKLVEAAILQLQLWLVKQPEFVNQAIGTHHEKIAAWEQWAQTVEERLKALSVNKDDIVADISAELKNEWIRYPFLERKRKNREKELWEFYKLPFGKLGEEDDPNIDIHMLLQKTIDSGNDRHNRMLVLMGAPGSGKTTVITYLLNNLKIDRPVRVYPLSGFVNMNPSDWPGDILTKVGKVQEDLSNSILILDGLDELDLHGRYDQFVEKLQIAWANNPDITNFTLILTCRTTRLDPDTLGCNYVILAPLSEQQILDFASDYLGECPSKLKDCLEENKGLCNVLGIPILLYMVLGLGLTVDPGTTIAGLYDEIFSTEGKNSIYKRGYNKKEHPVTADLSKKIHQFSQDVAVAMFSREEVQEELEKDSYISLAEKAIGKDSGYKPEDLLIGQYFLQGQEGQEIYFVHRSIFEYFVALAIFNALVKLAKIGKTPAELYGEMEPGKSCDLTPLATLLSLHHLSEFPEIKDFLHHLIQVNLEELSSFSDWAELAKLIFEYGLADAVPDRPHGGDWGLKEEEYRFLNLLDICRCILLKRQSGPVDLMPEYYHKGHSSFYWSLLNQIPNSDLSKLNLSNTLLSRTVFSSANLFEADLSGANLSGANLSETYLSEADLSRADLSGANLSESVLSGANLSGAHLYEAKLSLAILPRADLSGADLSEADLSLADVPVADLSRANLSKAFLFGADLSLADLYGARLYNTELSMATLPDNRKYEDALEDDGKDVMLQFTDPERWNKLHPDKAVDPDRFRRKKKDKS